MQLIVPYLFPPTRLREAAAPDLRLPSFETLLARGRLGACGAAGIEALVCDELGIARQQDYPVAPISLLADGGEPGEHYWLRADPVHLRVMRDRIVLAGSSELALTQDEADALVASIHAHFGDAFRLLALHPERWYLRVNPKSQLRTTPISLAIGCNIDPLLPQGDAAAALRAQLNELQMLLFDHPVNQAREARGALPVNSVWLWGGGSLPQRPQSSLRLYTADATLSALGRFAGAQVAPPPAEFVAALLDANTLIVLDHLQAAGQYGDALAWREALIALERDWFAPLREYLRGHAAPIRICDPVGGQALQFNRGDIWKIWRRRRPIG